MLPNMSSTKMLKSSWALGLGGSMSAVDPRLWDCSFVVVVEVRVSISLENVMLKDLKF